ncbi:aspartyl-phosphate phosphatase Spo0E family protein [Metabacillus endolithicus]|uniref:Spo0E family sporulation regulatory protein-aspartic acid phosphatase n=1 Tax=Metabacillus endolithicus TaxID=1535204 RepID=A0ABW5C1F0_9BACI|nr:aspartyl-phosphate phosphatase Spo0E family protein [Metabacillus endolithicus]UPG62604.1 aspartyl-phosphate phosphatase Spo0E family protein [Metabacillus endolithicus]
MIEAVNKYGLNDTRTISISKQLDQLLNRQTNYKYGLKNEKILQLFQGVN